MNTTNYIIELFISGITTFTWVSIILLTFIGADLSIYYSSFSETEKLVTSISIAPFVYTFGVISDRFIDNFFDNAFNKFIVKLREKYFPTYIEFREARSIIYLNSSSLTNLFEYGRIRIRISRNWMFNGSLILTTSLIFVWFNKFDIFSETLTLVKIKYSIILIFIILPSLYLAFLSWKTLNEKEYDFLKIQSEKIKDNNEKTKNIYNKM